MTSAANSTAVPILSSQDLTFVSDLVKQAGQLALDMRSAVTIGQKGEPLDFVTDADLACSQLLVEALRKRFPNDAVVSEEEPAGEDVSKFSRVWMIDPIDGTENYIANDGMYSVMVGLLIDHKPAYGWVYGPASDSLYVAVPGEPLRKHVGESVEELQPVTCRLNDQRVRLMMGNRDRDKHPWVENIPGVEFVYSGSVGLRVAMIAEGNADVYMHLAGKLKVWDTAAPAAMAQAAGLEFGSLEFDGIPYLLTRKNMHEFPLAIGTGGTLDWMRRTVGAGAQ